MQTQIEMMRKTGLYENSGHVRDIQACHPYSTHISWTTTSQLRLEETGNPIYKEGLFEQFDGSKLFRELSEIISRMFRFTTHSANLRRKLAGQDQIYQKN